MDDSCLYLLAQDIERFMKLQIIKGKFSAWLSNVDDMQEIVLKTLERIEIIRPNDSLEFLASLKVLEVRDAIILSKLQTLFRLIFLPFSLCFERDVNCSTSDFSSPHYPE